MDTKLALVTTARHELGAVLRAAQKRRPWHYALSGVATHDLTLASLLRMTPEQSDLHYAKKQTKVLINNNCEL
jgi:hypothetical protein